MDANFKFREQVAVMAALHASSQSVGTATTAWVSAANFHRFAALVDIGSVGGAGTVSVAVLQATDAAGTGAKAITSSLSGSTVGTAAPVTTGNQAVEVGMPTDWLDGNNGYGYVALQVVVAGNAVLTQGTLFGVVPRLAPASQFSTAVTYA